MRLSSDFLDRVETAMGRIPGPLTVPWPMPGRPDAFPTFEIFGDWRTFALQFGLRDGLPLVVSSKFDRAHKLLLLAWLDADLLKAAELTAFTAPELALRDRNGPQTKKAYGNMKFGHLLRYLPEHDGLTDDKVPMNRRCRGGTVVGLLAGEPKPDLADIRNDLAHGYPFEGGPRSGDFELIRDLIEYTYRDFR